MSMPKLEPLFTVDDYLRLERAAVDRHEFLDGRVFAMAGESGPHGDVSANIVASIVTQLKGTPCRARTKDTKVRSGPERPHHAGASGLFSYPDVVVICGEPVYHDEYEDVVLNPTAIIEVLSPSTEAFDRGEKFNRMINGNPTLQNYVLVSQQQPHIDVFHRQGDGTWKFEPIAGLEKTASIASIHCTLPLADVYDRIEFPPDSTE